VNTLHKANVNNLKIHKNHRRPHKKISPATSGPRG